ncbi:MAG TPA: ABC transporter ATP-binding protein [Gammaproteobacteria bacterium]|nr:ABC transporter ATP-binding protein [Gammaproteobacteria bacterium]HPI94761.1 ABC transporter ATP-binding protein [Gammaproteobacteria bacterium]HPQ86354.1 ABC transporter ATP-binding protein [Gammaproteobacteria bacterium]
MTIASQDIVNAVGLSKNYGKFKALDNVNINIGKGKIVGLIGPNGAGKTTLLKSLLGLTSYDGDLQIMGLNPFKQRAQLMEDICFIADVAVLPDWIKVCELLDFVEQTHAKFSRSKAEAFLKKTKIGSKQKVKSMSKGMVVQLHLAIVMSIEAKLLVLDEPTLGLDIIYRKEFYDNLLNDYFDHERTIIITTHQVEEVEHILTDLLFIKDGRIVLDSSMEELTADYLEVMMPSENYEDGMSFNPLTVRKIFGKYVMLFKNVNRGELSALGEVQRPGVADLFVALLKDGGLS